MPFKIIIQGWLTATTRRLDTDYVQNSYKGNIVLNLVTIRDTCPWLFPYNCFIVLMIIAAYVNAIRYCE